MGARDQSERVGAQPGARERARFHERERLNRLERGTRKDEGARLAGPREKTATVIDDRDVPTMNALHVPAAKHVDQGIRVDGSRRGIDRERLPLRRQEEPRYRSLPIDLSLLELTAIVDV